MVSAWLRAAVRLQQPGLGTACIANGSAGRFSGLPAADHGGAGHAHQSRVAGSPGLATFHSAGVAQRGAVVGGHGRTGRFCSLTRDLPTIHRLEEDNMAAIGTESVLSVHHWNDTLFSFKTTRDQSLRFENGHFVMIGLQVEDKPLMRAYSIVSANHDDYLEFLSIKVADG